MAEGRCLLWRGSTRNHSPMVSCQSGRMAHAVTNENWSTRMVKTTPRGRMHRWAMVTWATNSKAMGMYLDVFLYPLSSILYRMLCFVTRFIL